jgi:hypothetical protein
VLIADAILEVNEPFIVSSPNSGTCLESARFDVLFTERLGSTTVEALVAALEQMLRIPCRQTTTPSHRAFVYPELPTREQ